MIAELFETPISFDEFIEGLPESSENRYELHRGRIIEMPKPRGKHSKVAGFAIKKLNNAIDAAQLPYFIPRECIIRSVDSVSGYEPDVVVLDEPALVDEPRWESGSILTLGKSIKLIVEVVSTNWQTDYSAKLTDYESLGIAEYWIVDYAALGGRRFIGNPKQPTVTVCSLIDGEYELQPFQANESIISAIFPELTLTAEQIFEAV
jgi:Uma2 family endonuclease